MYDLYGSGWFMVDFDNTTGTAEATVKIIPGYTLRFSNMAAGTTYSAEETAESSAGYEVSYAYDHQAYKNGQPDGDPVPDTGDVHSVVVNQANNITVTNKRSKSDLIIIKTDDKGTAITSELDTARFQLLKNTKDDGSGSWINAEDTGDDPRKIADGILTVSSKDGIELKGLSDGLYKLTETKAPDGYVIISSPAIFRLSGGDLTFVTISAGGEVTELEEAPEGYSITPGEGGAAISLKVANQPGAQLPSSGGPGTTWIYLIGSILMLGCGIMLISRRRMVGKP